MKKWKPPARVYVVVSKSSASKPVLHASWSKVACRMWCKLSLIPQDFLILGPYATAEKESKET